MKGVINLNVINKTLTVTEATITILKPNGETEKKTVRKRGNYPTWEKFTKNERKKYKNCVCEKIEVFELHYQMDLTDFIKSAELISKNKI